MAAGDPGLRQPKWANAAAYVANPPNGDPSPKSFEAALNYIERKTMRALSDLWAAHRNGKEPLVDVTEAIDALLDGLEPDFYAEVPAEQYQSQPGFDGEGYALALVKLDNGEGRVLFGSDKQLLSLAKRVRQRGILEESIAAYVERRRAEMLSEDSDEDAEPDEPDPSDLGVSPIIASVAQESDAGGDSQLSRCAAASAGASEDNQSRPVVVKLVKAAHKVKLARPESKPMQITVTELARGPRAVIRPAGCPLRGAGGGCPTRKICAGKDECLEVQRRAAPAAA